MAVGERRLFDWDFLIPLVQAHHVPGQLAVRPGRQGELELEGDGTRLD
jgi:hypothetical protein